MKKSSALSVENRHCLQFAGRSTVIDIAFPFILEALTKHVIVYFITCNLLRTNSSPSQAPVTNSAFYIISDDPRTRWNGGGGAGMCKWSTRCLQSAVGFRFLVHTDTPPPPQSWTTEAEHGLFSITTHQQLVWAVLFPRLSLVLSLMSPLLICQTTSLL